MEIEITSSEFLKALNLIQGITERKNTMPILSHILLQAQKGGLTLSATDLEVGMTVTCEAAVRGQGRTAAPGRKLFEIIRELPEGAPISIATEENYWMDIACLKSKFRISGLNPEDFPTLPQFDEMEYGTMEGEGLRDMIEKTIYAVSQDEVRKNLNGVYIEGVDKSLRMVATDGHRLVYVDARGAISGLGKKGPLISRKGIMEVKKILDEGEKEVKLALTQNSLLLRGERVAFFTRLVEGEFPDYRMVVPKEGKKKITANRADLLTSLRRAAVIMGGKSPAVKITVSKGLIQFSSTNPEIGEARDEVSVDYEGDKMEIGMNARYLIEPLSVLTEETILIEMTDEASPLLLRKKESKDYIAVIMPMRLT